MRLQLWSSFGWQCWVCLFVLLLLAAASDGSTRVSSRRSTLFDLDSSGTNIPTATSLSRRRLVSQVHNQKWILQAAAQAGVQNWQQQKGPQQQQQQQQQAHALNAGEPLQGGVAQQQQLAQKQQWLQDHNVDAAPKAPQAGPHLGWMARCCSHKHLRDLFLPGTHDSGTSYSWTLPTHLPLVFDEVAALVFNIVGDLSRTQHLTVYEQLQAGARVLDLRLAVNPWIPLQARTSQTHWQASTGSPASLQSTLHIPLQAHTQQNQQTAAHLHVDLTPATTATLAAAVTRRRQFEVMRTAAPEQARSVQAQQQAAKLQRVFQFDNQRLAGSIDMAAVGGPLTAAELHEAVVISHSLPGAQLAHVLADVRRFLVEQPTEVVVVMVKADTVDVNVAGVQRMDDDAWAAAAQLFKEALGGVQLLRKTQVEQQTLEQIAESAPQGSVLLYSWDLQQQGLPSVNSHQLQILESWGNGTNSEEVPDLKARLLGWLQFWQSRQWRQNSKPFMLMASAEVTLGVQTILKLIKNRIWMTTQHQQQQQQPGAASARTSRLLQSYAELEKLGAVQSLFGLGIQTNREMLAEVLQNSQVSNSFNVWSLDALTNDITSYIISLNSAPQQHWGGQHTLAGQ